MERGFAPHWALPPRCLEHSQRLFLSQSRRGWRAQLGPFLFAQKTSQSPASLGRTWHISVPRHFLCADVLCASAHQTLTPSFGEDEKPEVQGVLGGAGS